MSTWSVFKQINKDPVTSPKSHEEPTFDPQDGFDGGDCCGSDVNTTYCSICECLENETNDSTCLISGITVMIGMLFFCYQ